MKSIINIKHKNYISELSKIEKIRHTSPSDYSIKLEDLKKEFRTHLDIMLIKRDILSDLNRKIRLNKKKSDNLYSILDKRFKILSWFIYLSIFIFISYSYFKPFFDDLFYYMKIIIEFDRYTIDISYCLFLIPIAMIYGLIIFVLIKILEKLIPFMDSLFFLYFFKSIKSLSRFIFSLKSYSLMGFYLKLMTFIFKRTYIIRIFYFSMLLLLIIIVKK